MGNSVCRILIKAFSFCLSIAFSLSVNGDNIRQSSATIDRLIDAKLQEMRIGPSDRCSDAVFIRRIYLDMIGTIPHPYEVKMFLNSKDPNKRSRLITTLFERDEFADYWSLKWCDLLRVKAEFPSNLWPNAVQAYHRWLWAAMRDNMPYDQFCKALLTSSGSNFREAPVNFYRALAKREPLQMAQAAALLFMGVRSECFSTEQWNGLAAFFGRVGYKKTAEWKEEIVFFDSTKVFLDHDSKQPVLPSFPDGSIVQLTTEQDPRTVFADWLIQPDNKWFCHNIVNRVWFWMLGRGIVHEPDNMGLHNPPTNPELLDFLAKELVDSNYNLRHIFEIILNSETYQRSSMHNKSNIKDELYFSHYMARRLDAEVLIDAICRITRTSELYSSAIPEPFTWIPVGQRSIALADGSITSPFLDLFGRPPRDTGFELERNNNPSSAQALHMLNSTHIKQKIQKLRLLGVNNILKAAKHESDKKQKFRAVVDQLYLGILSRYPTMEEIGIILKYTKGKNNKVVIIDVAWALMNSTEFMLKH